MKKPTVTRTTAWKGINPLGNGDPGCCREPPVPVALALDLHLVLLCRPSTATLISVCRRTAKQILSLTPTPLEKSQKTGHVRKGKVPS